jgi:molybdate transport system substrate-binding protein
MRVQVLAIVAVVEAVHLIGSATVQEAELKALFPITLTYTANQVIPEFEKGTGHKVMITYSTAGAVTTSVRMGVAADVAVTAAPQIDGLQNEGKIVPGSSTILAKVGVGLFVPKGHPKPDISSAEALKASLLSAKSIVYSNPALGGPVGIYMAKLLDQLGIDEQMKPKTRLSQGGEAVHTVAVDGEADFGFNMINEILADARLDLVGPLPPPVQDYTVFAAGLVSLSTQQDAARALIRFLSSPSTIAVMRMRGFE